MVNLQSLFSFFLVQITTKHGQPCTRPTSILTTFIKDGYYNLLGYGGVRCPVGTKEDVDGAVFTDVFMGNIYMHIYINI